MVIISEIVTVADLVVKATDLLFRLPDNWYTANFEIESFKCKLSILSQRTVQWKAQLNQFGMTEDPVLRKCLDQAAQLLDGEDDYYEKHRSSRFCKPRKRLFPGKLTYILSQVLNIVEAVPGLLAKSVETEELLTKRSLMTPSPLPFGYDPNYVPLQGVVNEVQRALEDAKGPQVVTLYGEPGIGKSSLAKYVALLYQDSARGSLPCSFDGVHYLFCGQGCRKDIHQLVKALLSNQPLAITDAIVEGQEGDHHSSSRQSALRRLLGNQKLLIILDDVWEQDFDVLANLVSRGTPNRYLITSQTRGIWLDARKVKVPRPDDEHALKILVSYTEGFESGGRTPFRAANLKAEIYEIIRKLENHPLSLVNVAISMNQWEATDINQWKVLAQNVFTFLDDNHYTGRILVYERPYALSVSDSMMLMVESLPKAERDLLFLIALLQDRFGSGIPESLIRFFFRRFNRDHNPSQSTFKYFSGVKHLEDNSLVQVDRSENGPTLGDSVDVSRLTIHNLRRQYIRQKRLSELQGIASSILATHGDDDKHLVNVPHSDQSLAVVLSTMYFDDALTDKFALPFQNVMAYMSGSVVPRGLEQQVDAPELVKSARCRGVWFHFDELIELLNLEGEEVWKQQVRADASKMIMKLVCQGELDDESMVSLLTLSHTTAAICVIFNWNYQCIYREDLRHGFYYGQQKSFSDTHPGTWKALSNLYDKNLTGTKYRCASNIIQWMLQFESERTVSTELQKLRELADQSPDPLVRSLVYDGFLGLHDSRLTCKMLRGLDLQEYLPTILWRMIDHEGHLQSDWHGRYRRVLECVYRDKGYAEALLTFPIPCDEWLTNASLFRRLLRLEQKYGPRSLLGLLSGTPVFQAKAAEILKGDCTETDFTRWPESYSGRLARFWGNVALVRDLHEITKMRLVTVAENWIAKLSKGLICSSCTLDRSSARCGCCSDDKSISWESVREVTRTVTIISHFHANSSLIIPSLRTSQQNCQTSTCTTGGIEGAVDCLARIGEARAYEQMQMYAEAIPYLHSAQQACDSIPADSSTPFSFRFCPDLIQNELRSHNVFVKALSKDYQGAMDLLHQHRPDLDPNSGEFGQPALSMEWKNWNFWELGDSAVLFRLSGEFRTAIQNFDRSLKCWEERTFGEIRYYLCGDPRIHNFIRYRLLEHRGYAKYLMKDYEGAKLDMESAQNLISNKLTLEPVSWEYLSQSPIFFSSCSSGEAGLKYSLLQLPINYHELLL